MNDLIEKSEKLTKLLIEYRESKIYESCKYHLIKDEGTNLDRYFLYLIDTRQQLLYGTKESVIHYINLRKIDSSEIYNYQIINS